MTYLSRISYQAEGQKHWHRLSVSQDWGEVGSQLSDIRPPSCLCFVPDCHPSHGVFFLTSLSVLPPLPLNTFFQFRYFSVYLFSAPFLQPWSLPAGNVSSIRGGHEAQFGFLSDPWGRLEPGGGRRQRESRSAATRSSQRTYRCSLSVNPPRGLGRGSFPWYTYSVQQQSDPISAFNVILHRRNPNGHNADGYEYPCWGYYPSAQGKSLLKGLTVFAFTVLSF